MKIKTVCERTGLTDRTIRYYIEEGLISPAFTENYLGRKSFDFTEENISELTDIAVLRSFDFSIDEIKLILYEPSSSFAVIKAVKERVNGELNTGQKKMSVLSSLNDQTAYTVAELARELSKPHEVIPAEETIKVKLGRRMEALVRGVLIFLAIWLPFIAGVAVVIASYVSCENPIINYRFLGWTSLTLIPSLACMFTSWVKVLLQKMIKTVLLFFCVLCIPLSVFTASNIVNECEHRFSDIIPGVAATCSATGLTDGSHCMACGMELAGQKIIPMTEHVYVRINTDATCGQDGYVLMFCRCGKSYFERTLFANEKHSFVKKGDKGFRCASCDLEVCEYGYIDSEHTGSNDAVKYYITGTADDRKEQERTLVIYGIGDMPFREKDKNYPYRASRFVEEIKTVIICDQVTSLAKDAFDGASDEDDFWGNPFRSVTTFIVKGDLLTLDPESVQMSGIKCDVTYQRSYK